VSGYHTSVLLQESVDALRIREDGVYVDCTLGGGGHSRAILERLGPKGTLLVFDHDPDAWNNAPNDPRVILIKENFRYLKPYLKFYKFPRVDGILADLGVSSFQFDTASRGFSTRFDATLDMRMDNRQEKTAADLLNNYSEIQLHKLFEQYGEVRNAIVAKRGQAKLRTIEQFKQMIAPCIKGNARKYLAQVFQALRIEVNGEMEVLRDFLEQTPYCLKTAGRLCIITFHSLEDRMVKQFMKTGSFSALTTDAFGRRIAAPPFKVLKDIVPSEQEQNNNSTHCGKNLNQ
jgi:16S rRNA (cytosine1402-N4)-methyltransferase